MNKLTPLLQRNKLWSASIHSDDPTFFKKLSAQQNPEYLWIGCSDSRVPANQIVGLLPGELFVHRNVANIVGHTDLNCLSVIQYAVDVLKIKHIIVCGHYGCGGVRAAYERTPLGLIDNWLMHIHDVYLRAKDEIESQKNHEAKLDRLCELNVAEQVHNVCQTTIVRNAWQRGQDLTIHGWVYGLKDGLLNDLKVSYSGELSLLE